jgi:hypothetical protein
MIPQRRLLIWSVLLALTLVAQPAAAQGNDGWWVGAGVGNTYGGAFGGGVEYRERGFSSFMGVGKWNDEIGLTWAGRGRLGGEKKAYWELGYGPIAQEWSLSDGVKDDLKVYNGVYVNVGYALALGAASELQGSIGMGYNSKLADSILNRSTTLTAGIGLQVSLAGLAM